MGLQCLFFYFILFSFFIENADLLFSKLLVRNDWLGQKDLFGKNSTFLK